MRYGKWKAVRYDVAKNPHGPVELYNLNQDPSEEKDLARNFPEVAAKLTKMMDGSRETHEEGRFNFPLKKAKK